MNLHDLHVELCLKKRNDVIRERVVRIDEQYTRLWDHWGLLHDKLQRLGETKPQSCCVTIKVQVLAKVEGQKKIGKNTWNN